MVVFGHEIDKNDALHAAKAFETRIYRSGGFRETIMMLMLHGY